MLLNLIEIFKTSNTPKTRTYIANFSFYFCFKNPYDSNILSSKHTAFYADSHCIIYI